MDALALIAPPHCLEKYFPTASLLAPEFAALLDVPCGKAVVSKVLGYGIVAGSALVKLPQILKITKQSSVAGLSGTSINMEMLSSTCSLAYYAALGYPFSTCVAAPDRTRARPPSRDSHALELTHQLRAAVWQLGRELLPLHPERRHHHAVLWLLAGLLCEPCLPRGGRRVRRSRHDALPPHGAAV
tara:strand:+ start:95 stop:652 length:558 start_codon:yes stop_codon:yes gene_type:complete